MIHMAHARGLPARMMEAVDAVNEAQKDVLGQKILDHFGDDLAGKTVAVWGLAFKPRTDDVREAPALVLIDALLAAGVDAAGPRPRGDRQRPRDLRRPPDLLRPPLRRARSRPTPWRS